jgi:hypothetical protein
MKLEFLDRFLSDRQTSNFMKIRQLETELFHSEECSDRRTDDKANSPISNFAIALKNT